MKILDTPILAVKLILPTVFSDERGVFFEVYQHNRFSQHIPEMPAFVQDNFSHSQKGVLRGLHYQSECPQGKLVSVLRGCIFDVAVDLRVDSPTFGAWVGVELSSENRHQLWIPEGFAHGFYTLSDTADVYYKCTNYYRPGADHTLRWDDPGVAIQWPLHNTPLLSEKDAAGLSLAQYQASILATVKSAS